METKKTIQDIRALISTSETEEAIRRTRQLLVETQEEEGLVHLDRIESEWNDIQEQYINGLLAVEKT
jgi:lipase chaperone LimK